MANEIIETSGELVPEAGDTSLAVRLSRAEIDGQISTARAYPRDLAGAQKNIKALATMSRDAAALMLYSLPRAGKDISGPGIRFAEAVAQSFGNCRISARVIEVSRTSKYVEAEGIFHDLQTNMASTARVRRRISGKDGRLLNDDMITIVGNAACSIARRNAILAGVPRALWAPAYDAAVQKVAGNIADVGKRLEQAIAWFMGKGAKEEQLLAVLALEDKTKVLPEHIVRLEGMASALKNGETTLEELLNTRVTAEHAVVENPLADEPAAAKEAKGKKEKAA